jgi:prolipoprotein diacylglyceryltransferase
MTAVRRIFSVFYDGRSYISLAYVLLRLPFAVIYAGTIAFILFRGLENVLTLVLRVPAGMAIWGGVVLTLCVAIAIDEMSESDRR